MVYIPRKLEKTLKTYLPKPEIIALVGARQCGKTTILKKIYSELSDAQYITFEDHDELILFDQDIKSFAQKYTSFKYLFIDEFQYSTQGGKHLKYLFDTHPELKIIISGSSAIDLTVRVIKNLVGRVVVLTLYPLDFAEFLSFRDQGLYSVYLDLLKKIDINNLKIKKFKITPALNTQFTRVLEEFLLFGGYPRVVTANSTEEKRLILKNIHDTYFLREVRDTLGLISDFKLSNLIKILSLQIGQLIEYKKLSQATGLNYLTLKKYLNFLDKTFVAHFIRPYFSNKRKEIIKNPKVYFFDTGLRNTTIKDFRKLSDRVDSGMLYENMVVSEFQKKDMNLNFWRTKALSEVDFILQRAEGAVPIECKSTWSVGKTTKSYASFMESYHTRQGIIFNSNEYGVATSKNTQTYYLPYWIL